MGNNASSEGGRTTRPFTRSNALGLSRAEVDQRCKPSGLYQSWQWDDRTIRKLIANGQLAARQKGTDSRVSMLDHECPICFLHYSQVNITKCCQADICTECYLQVKPQKEKSVICPFCNSPRLTIQVAKQITKSAIQERQSNEQRVIEAKIRAQTTTTASSSSDNDDASVERQSSGGFGSNLEQNTAVRLMRARSESFASSSHGGTETPDDVASIAMTPEDRHVLEQEIQAQHTHPLARQVQQEAEERRLENERNFYRSQPGRIQSRTAEMRARNARMARLANDSSLLGSNRRTSSNSRNWNEIVNAFEQSSGASVNTLDDLVVLEAAILLSMAEEDRRRENQDGASSGDDTNQEASARFDASQHARQGFPLVHSLLTDPDSARNVAAATAAARRPSSSSRRAASLRNLDENVMSSMLLRGISEAEQIEMAIAMSLQQSEQQQESDAANENQEESPSGSGDAQQDGSAARSVDSQTSERSSDECASASSRDSSTLETERGEANLKRSGSDASQEPGDTGTVPDVATGSLKQAPSDDQEALVTSTVESAEQDCGVASLDEAQSKNDDVDAGESEVSSMPERKDVPEQVGDGSDKAVSVTSSSASNEDASSKDQVA